MRKVLVANRGEIAIRVIRSLNKMGITSAALYSDADQYALHVSLADEAYYIGKAPSAESYLQMDRIIDTAIEHACDGIHPGYGFLSENAEFAQKVEDAGISFIGPSPEAIRIMGSKLAAKAAVENYNVPMVPGVDKAIDDISEAKIIADEIGYPILIKASAGGGGKGMRIVKHESEFESQMERAVSEAESAFGDGSVFIEKYISNPKHIEFQILADKAGHTVHLFERECSIQRRHQKVIEEAPSASMSHELRKQMGEAAVLVAKSCAYIGAGTVEFLMDEDQNFYFLEMNTRLQVEHPVTEFITGMDLVEQQIRVARGEDLSFKQDDLKIKGHAIELRIYAENPYNDFLPSTGTLEKCVLPEMKNVRIDNGYVEGNEVPIYYDPLISKLVCYGNNREEAIKLMDEAIGGYHIEGIETTLSFGKFVMNHPAFISGNYSTNFVDQYFNPKNMLQELASSTELGAQVANYLYQKEHATLKRIEHN